MVIDQYKDYIVRTATLDDVQAMYDILEPLVCDKTRFKFQYQTQQRQLRMRLEFQVQKKQSMVIVKGTEVVAVYVGDSDFVLHIATKYRSRTLYILLGYNVLCRMHGRYVTSGFVPLTHEGAYQFKTDAFGEGTIVMGEEYSYVTVKYKDALEKLYVKLKG